MRKVASLLTGLIAVSIPFVLIGVTLRLILLPAFLQLEYRMPYFPPDDYGFDTQERLRWSSFAWNYLVNSSGVSYLEDLSFADGSAVFNERELSHMEDVKAVVRGALVAFQVALAVLAVGGIAAWRADLLRDYRRGIRQGGWLTVGLAALIGAIVAVGMAADPDVFWAFFTFFHGLFFQGDSWLFAYSDTLIRLFPIRFWQDTFLLAALMVLGGGLALAFGFREPPAAVLARS